jgi:hypothetical protein
LGIPARKLRGIGKIRELALPIRGEILTSVIM